MSPESLNLRGHILVAEIAALSRSHQLKRDDFARLTADSWTDRMEAVTQRQGLGRVNLPGALKKFMKQRFPAFPFDHSMADLHRFTNKVSDQLSLYIEFERIHHYGLGKTFAIHLGAVQNDALHNRHGFRINLMSFFDRSNMNWTYGSTEELDACLEEVAVLLAIVLPPYQAGWKPPHLENLSASEAMTFHAAAELAYRQYQTLYPQFSTMGHAAWIDGGAGLRPTGTWAISFNDDAADRALRIDVLPSGHILFALGSQGYVRRGNTMFRTHPRRYPDEHLALPAQPVAATIIRSRPWEGFLDSPRALEIANQHGGADFAMGSTNFFTQVQFHAQRSDPPSDDEEWRIFYHDLTPARRHLNVRMSARSGDVLPAL